MCTRSCGYYKHKILSYLHEKVQKSYFLNFFSPVFLYWVHTDLSVHIQRNCLVATETDRKTSKGLQVHNQVKVSL